MKKLSVFLAAVMMFVMVAASMGNAETIYALPEESIDFRNQNWYDSSKAGTVIYYWSSIDYATAATEDYSGYKFALCPVDNVTLDAAVVVYDVKNDYKHISDERQWASLTYAQALPYDIPEGEYIEALFGPDGNLVYADSYMTQDGLKYNGSTRVNKEIVQASAWLMNDDGYAYAYVYSESPLINASTYPTFYAADKTTPITSFVDYTVGTGTYDDSTVHFYKLQILDAEPFAFDENGLTYLYYTMGTPTLPSGNDGGVGLYRCDANSIAWTTAFDLNARVAEYPEMFSLDDPFNPSSSSSEEDSAPVEVPVEQEVVLPSGEEVRMISASPYEYVIGAPEVVPTGASFSNSKVVAGDGLTLTTAAVEKYVGAGLEMAVFEMELTAEDGSAITQLSDYINVTLPIPMGITLDEGKTIVMYRYEDNGTLTRCDTVVDEELVTFATNHFSLYVMVEQDASAGPSLVRGTSGSSAVTSPKTADMSMIPAMMTAISGMGIAVVAMKKKNEI